MKNARHHTPETREKISLGNLGKKMNEESRLKMSLAHKGKHYAGSFKAGQIPWNKGKHHTPETCLKISVVKGGRNVVFGHGYIQVYRPDLFDANSWGYVGEHRLIMENKLGRKLRHGEIVHHIDFDKINNNPNNLSIFNSHSEHKEYHRHINKLFEHWLGG